MRRFLTQTLFLTACVAVAFILLLSMANGHADPYYMRFTSPRQDNMILGTSRAAQGIQPGVLNGAFELEFFNYAFTIGHSPFGPTYLESVRKKLNPESSDGIHIISVDPWSISSMVTPPDDSSNFRELDLCLANTDIVDKKPNFPYLFKNLKGSYKNIIFHRKSTLFLHDDGWLEVNNINMDTHPVNRRTANKLASYRKDYLPYYSYSGLRLEYLKKTIDLLSRHGEVYLVRLPMDSQMLELEDQFMPDFNLKMEELIPLTGGYYDMTVLNEQFRYTDGNHLYKESGKKATALIADWIRKQ